MARVEIGAWIEGTVAKRDGKGVRKVWVLGENAPVEALKLAVIAGERDTHVVSVRVHDAEARKAAREALVAALAGLDAFEAHLAKPAPAPKAPKAPTPPHKSTAQAVADARATTRNPAPASKPAPQAPALDGADWFAQIMASA